jgi:ABC-2 type transport system permease protein
MDGLLRILNLTWKELLTLVKDPRSRVSLILPPLMQVLVFGYAATYDLNSVPYVVLDQDRSSASRQLLAGFDGAGAFHRLADLNDPAAVADKVERRGALMVVHVPADFERKLLRGEPSQVQVIVDGRNSNTAGTAVSYANSIVGAFNARWKQDHPSAAKPSVSITPTVRLVERAWYNPNLDTRWNMVPGLLAMLTLLDVTLLASLSVAREREQGTLDQLLVTPMGPLEVLAGKALPTIVVGLVQATVVLLATLFWFRIPFAGSYLMLYGALLLFLCAAVGVGLLISATSATMQQAMLGCFVVLMPFALLSGLSTPISSMPRWVQAFTLVNPLRWGTTVVHRVFLEGAGPAQVLPQLLPLAAIALVSFVAAAWAFRHRLA